MRFTAVIVSLLASLALLLAWKNPSLRPSRRCASRVRSSLLVPPEVPYVRLPRLIKDVVAPESIQSIRIRHIRLYSKELAENCRMMLLQGQGDFDQLVKTVSTCTLTKDTNGDFGWIEVSKSHESIAPAELINAAFSMSKGDIKIVSSTAVDSITNTPVESYHVVQLIDVINKLSPQLRKKKANNYKDMVAKDEKDLRYFIETMGCQMNVADSERMEAQLQELGYLKTANATEAHMVVINTCAIRDHAEQKVYSHIGPHAARRRRGDDVSILVTGCVAQQEGEHILKRFPEVDAVMGPQYSNRVMEIVPLVREGHQLVATDPAYQSEDSLAPLRRSDITAFVNVIYGCNERCTYCVVPNTRGVEQSRTKDAIMEEVRALVQENYKEVTLLGQNIDAWGKDMNPKQRFADLLVAVAKVPGIQRVRFLTSHPKAVAENPQLMPCFNIPFQSGDNEVLKFMRRGYSRERYLDIIRQIRDILPDAAITADCIVGFPGETEEQFQQTLSLMEEVKFEQVNTAAYSPRPNTPAATWENQVPEDVKQDRLQRINRLGAQHALERSQRFVGRVQEVLVEEVNIKNPRQVIGRNPHSRLVFFEGNYQSLKGRTVQVRITEAKAYSLVGELVK
eukprot:gene29006-35011_t